jgi:hypothetical protein
VQNLTITVTLLSFVPQSRRHRSKQYQHRKFNFCFFGWPDGRKLLVGKGPVKLADIRVDVRRTTSGPSDISF